MAGNNSPDEPDIRNFCNIFTPIAIAPLHGTTRKSSASLAPSAGRVECYVPRSCTYHIMILHWLYEFILGHLDFTRAVIRIRHPPHILC